MLNSDYVVGFGCLSWPKAISHFALLISIVVDLEHAPDVLDEELNNSTDENPQNGSDATNNGSSVEAISHPGQNDKTIPCSTEAGESTELEPYVGQEFKSEVAALEFYCAYAARTGFLTRMRDHNCSQRDGSIISRTIVCNREGFRKHTDRPQLPWSRKPRAITRVGCKARISFRKQVNGIWVVRSFVKEHTHALALHDEPAPKPKNRQIYEVPADDNRIQDLMRQVMVEKKRNTALREFINLLFNHIEEHTQGLSEKIQYIVEKVNKMESEGKDHQDLR